MTDQLTYAPEELLASHDPVEPLVLGGQRMHGGFDSDGIYVSPRSRPEFHDLETPDPVIDEPAPAKVGAQPSY